MAIQWTSCLLPIAFGAVLAAPAAAESHAAFDLKRYGDLVFQPTGESVDAELSIVWGNPETGPFGMMLRLPGG